MQTCGEVECALRVIATKKVIVCYELADEFAELYRRYGHSMAFSLDPAVAVAPKPGREAAAVRKQKSFRAKRPLR